MTERRKLKQTVRARMSRTGESYTTARRHVAGSATAQASHRESALVRHMLAAAGIDLSEPMVCGLGGGIGFLYAVFSYAQVAHPLLTIVAQHHPQPWAPAVLDRLGVEYREQHSTSTSSALAKLDAALATGPALCTVDRSPLPGHSSTPMFSAADPYPVLVLGMTAERVRYLDDGRDVGRDDGRTPVTVPTEVFAQAWTNHRKGRHHLLQITSTPAALNLAAAVADAVGTTVAHLTGPVLGNSFDVNFGLSGLARLAADLRARRGRSAWRTRFADHFDYMRHRLVECIQRELTAPDATRPLYADFLAEAAPLLDLPQASQAIAALRASGQGWSAITKLASDPGPKQPDAVYDELAELVDACLDHEQRFVEHVRGVTPTP